MKALRQQVVQEDVKITVPNNVLILAMAGAMAVVEQAVREVVEKIAI